MFGSKKLGRETLLKQVLRHLLKHKRVRAIQIYRGKSCQSFETSDEKQMLK